MNVISNILYWISTGLLVPVIVLLIFFHKSHHSHWRVFRPVSSAQENRNSSLWQNQATHHRQLSRICGLTSGEAPKPDDGLRQADCGGKRR